jgi:hypothetical protein
VSGKLKEAKKLTPQCLNPKVRQLKVRRHEEETGKCNATAASEKHHRFQACSNYGSYRQSVRLLGRGISPVARPLPTQGNINTQETRTDSHAPSGIRTHDSSVRAGENISCLRLRPRGHCDQQFVIRSLLNLSSVGLATISNIRKKVVSLEYT